MRRGLACLLLALCLPASAAAQPPRRAYPLRSFDPAALAADKRLAMAHGALANPLDTMTSPRGPSTFAAVGGPTANLNQPGLAATDNLSGASPPDPTGAVGPGHYVEMVNTTVAVYSKADLSLIGSRDLAAFAGASGKAVFDPQIQWDQQGGRWLYVADDCTDAPNFACASGNRLAVGFSKTTDPSNLSSGWCNYFIDTGTLFDDYPKLGHNDNNIIIGTNVFDSAGNGVSARIWTLAKPAPGTIGTCPAQTSLSVHYFSGSAASPVRDGDIAANPLRTSDGDFVATPVPANTADASANGYIVAADFPNTTANQIMAWHVSGSGSSPTLTADGNISVSTFAVPAPIPQPGTTDVLDSSDTRLTQAVALTNPDAGAETVWTQHTIDGAGGRSVVRWYELLPQTHAKRQEGVISNSTEFVFNGAISPSSSGNEAVIQYNLGGSGAGQFAELRASSRRHGDTLGTMGGEITLGTSANADQDFTCPSNDATASSCRWGDYAGATPDPSDPHLVWGTNQLLGAPNADNPRWTTRNFGLLVANAPYASFSFSPTVPAIGDPVQFDGTASSDPDSGMPVTFSWNFGDGSPADTSGATPTHAYAAAGTYTVSLTVTETDGGQSDTWSRHVVVSDRVPTASFTVTPSTATRGQAIAFDGSASNDPDGGGIAGYAWDFDGNGTTDQTTTGPTVTHAYTALGTVTAKLVVTDGDDALSSSPASRTISIQNAPPVADLSFTPAAPAVGDTVSFSAAGSSDPDGAIAAYRWDLDGDGVFETDTGATPSASRSYATAGTFKPTVEVKDANGATARKTVSLTVAQPGSGSATGPANTSPASPGALALKLTFPARVRLAVLVKRGLTGEVRCGRSCTLRLTLRLPAKVAKKLHVKAVIGSLRVKISGSTAKTVRVRLTKSARKALARQRRLTLTLTGTAVDGAGHSSSAKRVVRAKR